MKTFKEFVNESKASGNYYQIGGDPYDGGIVFNVYANGKKVHTQILDGDDDYVYKKKVYKTLDDVLDVIAKDNGLKSGKDLERDKKYA